MKEYRFLQNEFPVGYTIHFAESLFNTKEHRYLQSKNNWVSFYVVNDAACLVEACIHFSIQDHVATSPYRAPFGSMDFYEKLAPDILKAFILFIENSLEKLNVKSIEIKMPTMAYVQEPLTLLKNLFLENGFQISLSEVGSVIKLNDTLFADRVDESERYILNKCRKNSLVCVQRSIDQFDNVYAFIHEHLSLKGYALSMTQTSLAETVNTFPDKFFLFVVLDQEKVVAASISIQVNDHVLYNFYLAHDAAYNHMSPTVLIIEGLYNFCKKKNLSILDLGTSMLHGRPNVSLLNFKSRLGSEISEKITLLKKLV